MTYPDQDNREPSGNKLIAWIFGGVAAVLVAGVLLIAFNNQRSAPVATKPAATTTGSGTTAPAQ